MNVTDMVFDTEHFNLIGLIEIPIIRNVDRDQKIGCKYESSGVSLHRFIAIYIVHRFDDRLW